MQATSSGREWRIGWAIGVVLSLGCSVGGDGDGFSSTASISGGGGPPGGTGSTTTSESSDDSGVADGGATSVGDPSDTDDPPPGAEICNGLDDDGDGEIDEDQPDQSCGVGSCAVTQPTCVDGLPQRCTPALPGAEVCNGLDDDCNGMADDGVEQDCSTACGPGVIACVGGVEQACNAPPPQPEVCNLVDDDCNGAIDQGVAGCRVGVHRSVHPGTGEHFYTTDLGEAQCCGFNLESADYYDLYAGPQAGLVAFYRCLTPWGFHFYTQSPTCEGTTVEGIMGYIATAPDTAGSVPLYRLFLGSNGDHFYTTSAAERDNAINNIGYVDEGIAGYVW